MRLLQAPTRFAAWPRWAACAMIVGLLLLMAFGSSIQRTSINAENPALADTQPKGTDRELYDRIIEEMRAGKGYYEAAAPAHREGNYPLKPFFVFRLPTLATMLATVPAPLPQLLLIALTIAMMAAWAWRLFPAFSRPTIATIALLLLVCGSVTSVQPEMIVFHEIWASVLIALSLAVRTEGRWWPAVLIGLAAVLIRETALPYLLAMAGFALLERRWRELLGWSAAVALVGAFVAYHAVHVSAVVTSADPTSPGWSAMGGWRFFLSSMRLTTPLTMAPFWVSGIAIPLALLGWAGWRIPAALRTTAILCGFGLMLMLFARPDNFYWGLLIAPLLLVGLAFAPSALHDLVRVAVRPNPHLDTKLAARQ